MFLKLAATPAQTAAVRKLLQRAPEVRRFAFLTRVDAWREFRKLFAAQPDLIAGTTADQLPTSFRVELEHGAKAAAIQRRLRGVAGVDTVQLQGSSTKADRGELEDLESACVWRNSHPSASDMEVFLRLGATAAETDAVRTAIARSELVRTFAFVPRSEAIRLFRKMFATHPKILRSTTAADLPESFRIGLKDPTTRDQLTARADEPGRRRQRADREGCNGRGVPGARPRVELTRAVRTDGTT